MRDEEKLLTGWELTVIVAAVLPIFVFLGGPVWTHPYRIDAAVYWSYAPVPLLVLGLLLRRHVLSLSTFLVNTFTALSVKYLVTTGAAFVLWSVFDPPARAVASVEDPRAPSASKAAPSFETDRAMELAFDSRALQPSVVEVRAEQPLVFRSLDGQLHTARAVREDGSIIFNRPVIPGRSLAPVTLLKPGRVELSCAVHEGEAHRVVIAGAPASDASSPPALHTH